MGMPMEEVLESLPFSDEIRAALLRHEGPKGELLTAVLAYERGEFPSAPAAAPGRLARRRLPRRARVGRRGPPRRRRLTRSRRKEDAVAALNRPRGRSSSFTSRQAWMRSSA